MFCDGTHVSPMVVGTRSSRRDAAEAIVGCGGAREERRALLSNERECPLPLPE